MEALMTDESAEPEPFRGTLNIHSMLKSR